MIRLLSYLLIVQLVVVAGALAVEFYYQGEPVAITETLVVDQSSTDGDCLPPRAWLRTTMGDVCM